MSPARWVPWTVAIWLVAAAPAAARPDASCAGMDGAVVLFNEGARAAAYDSLRQLSAGDCREPIVYLYQGVYERGLGRNDDAIQTFRRGLGHDSANVQLLLELAVTYSWADRLGEALETYQAIRRLAPENTPARLGEARVMGWLGRRRDAIARFEAVLREQPRNVEALGGLAAVHLASLQPEAARRYYRQLLILDPANADARAGLRRADALRRLDVSASIISDRTVGSTRPGLRVSAAYQLTADVRIAGGYNGLTRDPKGPRLDVRDLELGADRPEEWRASFEWRADRRTVVGASAHAQSGASGAERAVAIDASRVLGRGLILFGTVRPSVAAIAGPAVRASVGVSVAASPRLTVVGQGFHAVSRTGRSAALAGTLRFPTWLGGTASATVALGSEGGTTSITVSGQTSVRVAPNLDVRLEGSTYRGRFRSTRLALTMAARF